MQQTPTKSISVLSVTPTTKQSVCIVCSGIIPSVKQRRRLYNGDEKTKISIKLESILNVNITQSDLSYSCESCARKLDTLEAKISKMKSQFEMNKENLCLRYGQGRVKRQARDDTQPNKTRRNIVHQYPAILPQSQYSVSQGKQSEKQNICVSIQLFCHYDHNE